MAAASRFGAGWQSPRQGPVIIDPAGMEADCSDLPYKFKTHNRGWFSYPRTMMTTNSVTIHTSQLRHILPVFLLCLVATPALGHEHDDEISEEDMNAPVDAILWIHIFLQAVVWGFLFPVGMVLGLSRSRWHVPIQVRTQST